MLEKYWSRFANDWDVLLHGNPTVDMYHGIKLSAGGELGIGVGEEEWGSGEREVFEDFAGRTEGLVDMVVSRFGEPSVDQIQPSRTSEHGKRTTRVPPLLEDPWLGRACDSGPADGVVFSGTGAISRSSLCAISDWTQQIYAYGEHAYGVRENPGSDRRRTRKRDAANGQTKLTEKLLEKHGDVSSAKPLPRRKSTREYPSIPPPIISAVERSLDKASAAAEVEQGSDNPSHGKDVSSDNGDTWTKYLTLGYGSTWGPSRSKQRSDLSEQPSPMLPPTQSNRDNESPNKARNRSESVAQPAMQNVDPEPEGRRLEDRLRAQVYAENTGYFIIGLKGSLDDDADAYEDESGEGGGEWNSRTLLRTLHVEVDKPLPPSRIVSDNSESLPVGNRSNIRLKRLRVVIYVVGLVTTLQLRVRPCN